MPAVQTKTEELVQFTNKFILHKNTELPESETVEGQTVKAKNPSRWGKESYQKESASKTMAKASGITLRKNT